MDLFSLNIIICIVLIVICWVVCFFVEPDSLKNSTKDIVALIVTALIFLVSVLPFLTPETVKKTDYTSFTITELSDKTTTVTVKEKNGKEKTFTSFTITEGVDNTITVTGVDGDLKKSEFTFDNGLNLKKTKKTIGQLELELLEKDSDGKETVPVLNQQDYDSLRNEIINSPDFGKK